MKKILSIAFVLAGFMFVAGTSSADAQTWRNGQNNRTQQRDNQNRGRGVNTYTETKIVRRNGKTFRETYEIKVFKNGRKTSKLISRVEINNRRGNGRNDRQIVNTYYQTETIRENGRRYRVTYKITEYRNGRTESQIVNKVRV